MSSLLHDIDVATKKATFCMGCFWGPDTLYGAMKGVIRTRVGYAGGTMKNPTYKNLGDHTEAIEIEYDPNEIKYEDLFDAYLNNHDPSARFKKQYTSLVLFHDEDQKKFAQEKLKAEQSKRGETFVTEVIPATEFYNAEDYHQKYRLQQHTKLMSMLGLKPGPLLIKSHVAARLNGYVVGMGGVAQFEEEWKKLGLSDEAAEYVRNYVTKFEGQGMIC